MQEEKLAYCGISCAQCPVFIATTNDDNELRQKTAKEWNGIYKDSLPNRGETFLVVHELPNKKMQQEHGINDVCSMQRL
jgi:hypothetical protein